MVNYILCNALDAIFEIYIVTYQRGGSPTNRTGGDKTRDQRSFGPSTGGPDLQGSLQPAELGNHLDKV